MLFKFLISIGGFIGAAMLWTIGVNIIGNYENKLWAFTILALYIGFMFYIFNHL